MMLNCISTFNRIILHKLFSPLQFGKIKERKKEKLIQYKKV